MRRDTFTVTLSLVAASMLAGVEIALNQGRHAALVFAAALITALAVSFVKVASTAEAGMTNGQGEDSITVKGFGAEADFRGPNIISRTVGSTMATNILLVGIAFGLYFHDNSSAEIQKKTAAGIIVANYLATQPEEKKLEIGKRLLMPEELRKQLSP